MHTYIYIYIISMYIQPIADGVAQNLEIISKNFQFSTWRLIGFIISTMLYPGTNRKSNGYNSASLTNFSKRSQDSVPPYLHLAI